MADISQVIQQGTDRATQQPLAIQEQARSLAATQSSHTQSMLQIQQQKMAMQARADQIADSVLLTVGQKDKKLSQVKGEMDKVFAQIDALPIDSPEREALDNRITDMSKLYDAALVERNTVIESVAQHKGVVAALDASSYSNNDLAKKLFTEETFNSMSHTQRNEVIGQLTAFHNAKEQMEREKKLEGLETEEYLKSRGRYRGKAEFDTSTDDDNLPRLSILTEQQYASNMLKAKTGESLGENKVKEYYLTDMAHYYPLYDKMVNMDQTSKDFVRDLFSNWTPDESVSWEEQNNEVAAFEKVLDQYEKAPTENEEVRKVLEDLRFIIDSGEDKHRPLRIGAFMEQLQGFFLPTKTKKIQPRTAESGG